MENHLINPMPWIVTSPAPLLLAAQVNTQAEFDRTFRTIVQSPQYQDKQLLFISCLNFDTPPAGGAAVSAHQVRTLGGLHPGW